MYIHRAIVSLSVSCYFTIQDDTSMYHILGENWHPQINHPSRRLTWFSSECVQKKKDMWRVFVSSQNLQIHTKPLIWPSAGTEAHLVLRVTFWKPLKRPRAVSRGPWLVLTPSSPCPPFCFFCVSYRELYKHDLQDQSLRAGLQKAQCQSALQPLY